MIEYTYDSNAIKESTLTLEETALKKKKRINIYCSNEMKQDLIN